MIWPISDDTRDRFDTRRASVRGGDMNRGSCGSFTRQRKLAEESKLKTAVMAKNGLAGSDYPMLCMYTVCKVFVI